MIAFLPREFEEAVVKKELEAAKTKGIPNGEAGIKKSPDAPFILMFV